MQLNAQLKLAFAAAAYLKYLTLLHNVTRWPVLQKVRGHTRNVLTQFVSTGFQVLFHSPPGVLFTFPSRYYALSVTAKYLALQGGPSCFPRGFTCPVVLWIISEVFSLRLLGCYLLWRSFPKLFVCNNLFLMICPQPLRSEVSTGFQVLFHSPPGVLFTFPSRYYALSVTAKYLALQGGPSCFPRGFTCPVVLWIISEVFSLRLLGCYLLWRSFPKLFVCNNLFLMICPQPLRSELLRFGLFRVRSPLLAESELSKTLRL